MNKSLFLVFAALAAGLALAGCSSEESTSTTNTQFVDRWNSIQSDVEKINAAFDDGVSVVKLNDDVTIEAGEILIIPAGKTLNLDAYTLTDSDAGYVVVKGTITPVQAGKVTLTQSYIIAEQSYLDLNVGTAGADGADTRPFTVPIGGSAVAYGTVSAATVFATDSLDDDQTAALNAGSTGVLLLNPYNLSTPLANTAGILIVKGDVNLSGSGTLGAGTLVVSGKLTSDIANQPDTVLAAGSVTAKSISVKGGQFGGTVTLTDKAGVSDVSGTQTTFTGGLDTPGNLIINAPVEFGIGDLAGKVYGLTTIGAAATLEGELIGTNAAIDAALTVAGTLAAAGKVTFGGGSIVFDGTGGFQLLGSGKLTTDKYELSGEGSLSVSAGTGVALTASGIKETGGLAGGTPTIVFADATLLNFKDSATIDNIALDVTDGGTIGIAGGKFLTFTGAGSLVTGAHAGSIAYADHSGSKAVIAAVSGGSLVAGSGSLTDSNIVAGSFGTISNERPGYIVANDPFVLVHSYNIEAAGTLAAIESGDNGATAAGSFGVFNTAKPAQ